VTIALEDRIMRVAPQSTVARLFDGMADDYDVLEPWYEHLYARLHEILVEQLGPRAADQRALDAGCGHGAQTALLCRLGYAAHGIDLAGRLLAIARRRLPGAVFCQADVTALPYRSGSFDVVTCAGSTLSFVDDPDAALRELARVLRPNGRLLLECEHKWSLDLGWAMASALCRDALGYGVSLGTLVRALRRPLHASISLHYPGYGILTLFSGRDLRRRLAAAGLRWERAWGIHGITNVIPSTALHRASVPRSLGGLYGALRRIDTAWSGTAPGRALANSLAVLAVRA
jgi:SAM-dependent methyltransferase